MKKNQEFTIVKGFKDFIGDEARKRKFVRDIIINIYEKYGFEPAETPIIEYEEFVKGDNLNDEIISDIYKLKDKGNRKLALRYELTFQLKRLIQGKRLPYRRYSIGTVFRDEPVSTNRLRQITQCDIDIVGSTILDESEILKVVQEILQKLDIQGIININNRKLLNEVLLEQGVSKNNLEQVIREVDKIDKLPKKEVIKRLKKYGAENLLNIFNKPVSFFEKYNSFKDIQLLQNYCRLYGVETNFSPSLARGLSYYNGTIFEVTTREMKESICGGGSYTLDGIPCTGLALGLERTCMLTKLKSKKDTIMIIPFENEKASIKIATFLRKKNKSCFINNQKVSKAMKYANSEKIPYVIFVGEDEIKKGKYKIRDMVSGIEEETSLEGLVPFIDKKY